MSNSTTPLAIKHRLAWAATARAMSEYMDYRTVTGVSSVDMELARLRDALVTELRTLLALCRKMDSATRRESHYVQAALGLVAACELSEDDLGEE